jgi:hypothetical protein
MNSRILFLSLLFPLSTALQAAPLMSKAEYEDYSVKYQCIQLRHVRDLKAKEAALSELEQAFHLNEDNFEEFDQLITEYERDDQLLDRIRSRVLTDCGE